MRAGLPDPRQRGPRQAAGLPRQRRHHAEAPRRSSTRSAVTTTPSNANIHRGRPLPERARHRWPTTASASGWPGSSTPRRPAEIIFTRGTTEAINLVAQSWGRSTLRPGDEILVTEMEHHSNIVPWQLVCRADRARCCARCRSPTPASSISTAFDRLLDRRAPGCVAVTHVSNVLGTINPVRRDRATRARARARWRWWTAPSRRRTCRWTCRRSAATSLPSRATRSSGPTGIGVLYGRAALLEAMPPWQGGGEHDRVRARSSAAPTRRRRRGSRPARRRSPR